MMRSILGVLAGVIVGIAAIFIIGRLTVGFFPVPATFDPTSAADVAARPFGAKALVVFAWFLGALVGGITTSLIGKRWAPAAWVVAATMLLFAISNFSAFPHPLWMMIASAPAAALGGFLAITITGARYGRPPTAERKTFP